MDQTVGSGADSLVLRISQDAYQGSAQYTVRVDGTQIGGTLTAETLHGTGRSDTVTVLGNWAAGNHTVTVDFLNDAWGGTAATDRNLYVDGATYNGAAVGGAARTLLSGGPFAFGFTEAATTTAPVPAPTPAPTPAASSPPTDAASATVGSGSDALVLKVAQDAYQGSAQYTVSVDGRQVGGTLTASALHGSGQADTVTVLGDWAAGAHTVSVNFLNDAWGGTASTDRNLYVEGATYNGTEVGGAARTLLSGGPVGFAFTEADAASPPPATQPTAPQQPSSAPPLAGAVSATVGSGSDTLELKISQDAWQGSAQYTVKVDGAQIGGVLTAQAAHGSGQSDALTVKGDWGRAPTGWTSSFSTTTGAAPRPPTATSIWTAPPTTAPISAAQPSRCCPTASPASISPRATRPRRARRPRRRPPR